MAYLIAIEGPSRGAVHPLQGLPAVLGRGEDCSIRLADDQVSREHARIDWPQGRCRIADLGSTNGIAVNGLPVAEAFLRPGDELAIGRSVFLFGGLEDVPAAAGSGGAPTVAASGRPDSPLRPPVRLPRPRSTPIVGRSPAMAEVYALVARIADSELPVLVLGESGTGKELVARALHTRSARRDEPFLPVNCANLGPTLLESELFGHEKGAFTGADERRLGCFEAAGAGTIFLDEVGEIEPSLQARLLRVLAEKEFTRVGGHAPIAAAARVVAATHRDLPAEIAAGRFREDLYYRLHVVPIRIPPLRERPEDIPPLVEHFVERCRRESGTRLAGFDPGAMAALVAHPWPGNVRELKNVVERASILGGPGRATLADLPRDIRDPVAAAGVPGGPGGPFVPLVEAERRHLLAALHAAGGRKTEAARLLGIERSTLYSKLKRHGIEAP